MSQPKRFDFWMYQKLNEEGQLRARMDIEFSEHGRCVYWEDYAALAAEKEAETKATFDAIRLITQLRDENERLRESQLSKNKWIACEQMHFQTADNLRDRLYQASMRIERLEKAGNTVVAAYCMGDWNTDKWKEYPVVAQWLAAKEGRDAK